LNQPIVSLKLVFGESQRARGKRIYDRLRRVFVRKSFGDGDNPFGSACDALAPSSNYAQ
jgi:hypothetical protein